jgi:hypothetical protein
MIYTTLRTPSDITHGHRTPKGSPYLDHGGTVAAVLVVLVTKVGSD